MSLPPPITYLLPPPFVPLMLVFIPPPPLGEPQFLKIIYVLSFSFLLVPNPRPYLAPRETAFSLTSVGLDKEREVICPSPSACSPSWSLRRLASPLCIFSGWFVVSAILSMLLFFCTRRVICCLLLILLDANAPTFTTWDDFSCG